jgi:hypothetical protein
LLITGQSSANGEPPQKKRVSFDAAAKQTDGSSAKDLMTAWQSREDELGWTAGFIIPEQFDKKFDQPEKPEKVKKVKSKKAKQPSAKRAVNSSSDNPPSALIYLRQYHSSRADWKFSKNKETWILKHLLSLNHIPSSYDLALRSYVSGLQSQAARSRVRTAAEEAIHRDQEEQSSEQNGNSDPKTHEGEMEDPVLRRKQYDSALARYKKQLEDSIDFADEEEEQERLDEKEERRLAKRKRAEVVLWELGSSEEPDTGDSPRNGFKRVKVEKEPKKVFNRKNRVSVVELSSSDDEEDDTSSSDSDSDDSSDHEPASNPNAASDSSSNSSPSASGSDSDSDSDDSSDENTTTTDTASRTLSRPTSQSRTEDDTSESDSSDDTETKSRPSRRSHS